MADTDLTESSVSFNLIDEPWIGVRWKSGETSLLSIRDVFLRAPQIAELANDLPTQDFAILRVLLAIFQRAMLYIEVETDDGETSPAALWGELWDSSALPMDAINMYLDTWHDRFDLFDKEHPFMQVPGLRTSAGDWSEVSKIIADVPDGLPFFTVRAGSRLKTLAYAEAARWLVHMQAFDTSGIKSGVVGDPSVKNGKSYPIGTGWAGQLGGFYAQGGDLRETLLLNLILSAGDDYTELFSEEDIPAWERDAHGFEAGEREPAGRADLYTWQSRRALLHEEGGSVTGLVLTNGCKLSAQNRQRIEPMTAWRRSQAQEKKARSSEPIFLPLRHDAGKAMWRGLDAVLPQVAQETSAYYPPGIVEWLCFLMGANAGYRLSEDYPMRLRACAFVYGTQSALFDEVIDDSLSLSAFLVSPDGKDADSVVRECLAATDKAVFELGKLARNLNAAAGDQDRTSDGARDDARRRAYFELDLRFRSWLSEIGPRSDLHGTRDCWLDAARKTLLRIGGDLVRQSSPEAVVGHACRLGQASTWMTAARAEAIFHAQLYKLLPDESVAEEQVAERPQREESLR